MSDNPSPAAQPEPSSEPIEFNFDKSASDVPRIKRRSLKGKAPGLKPASSPPTAHELERETPPLSVEQAAKSATPSPNGNGASQPSQESAPRGTPVAPPKATPATTSSAASPATAKVVSSSAPQRPVTPNPASAAVTHSQKPAPAVGISPSATGQKVNITLTAQQKATAAVLAASTPTSPHGTRPATLYYTSQPKNEASNSMKTTPAATTTSSATAASATRPAQAANTSATRPATATSPNSAATRPATATVSSASAPRAASTNFDYRANVERQSREQKSVGNILAYFVYGLIAIFVVGAGLATYGSLIIFDRLHDQATSISGLDDKYGQKVADLNKQLAATQDSLVQSQAQNARQLDLLNKQEEEINQLRAAISASNSASAEAIHSETHARAQETAALRARLRDLEYKTSVQNTTRP